MTHVAYLRVSTARQGVSGLGLEAQREAVGRHIAAAGGQLIAEFIEIETGKGSSLLRKRPQLRAALECARRAPATLIVAKLDRLTRSARLLLELVESANGAEMVFCDLPQLPKGPVGRFMLTQLAAVAEFEAGMIAERTKAALRAASARGVKLGANGARLAAIRKAGALAFAQSVGQELAKARLAGCSTFGAIADHLNRAEIATASGGIWHPTTVQRVERRLAASSPPADAAGGKARP